MKKSLTIWVVLFLVNIIPHLGFGNINTNIDENGGYYDFDISSAPSFFLADADELNVNLTAKIPDIMPVDGRVTSEFGWRKLSRRRARMHLGVDIAAPVGTPIYAPADGRVAFVGRKGGYGLTVILEHGGEVTTLFAHNSKIDVKPGEAVKKGQEISRIGMSGHSTGPHVHYEVRIGGSPVNPSRYL